MKNLIINRDKSIVIACDVDLRRFEEIVRETTGIDGIGGYKVGFGLALAHGLPKVVQLARKYTNKPLIYDHQKAGTDIPDTGELFAKTCKEAGVDAVILMCQSGPETEKSWIKACQQEKLGVIVGGLMTHKSYLRSDGGFIADEAVGEIYSIAADLGVTDFVVPGNKPEEITKIKKLLESKNVKPVFYAPGFVAQGGEISEAAEAAGENWHAIVGRGICEAKNMRETALKYAGKL